VTGVTPAELARVLTFLPRNRFLYLLRQTVMPRGGDEPPGLRPKTVLVMGLYDWFAHLGGYITDDQQQRVVKTFDTQLAMYCLAAPAGAPPVPLTLSDGRYAVVAGRTEWYDYELDENVAELPGPCVTHLSCDLTALQLRLHERIGHLRGGKDVPAKCGDGGADRAAAGFG